ncbi:hypothetical protein, partial [Salmonella enterica]|uniref:hypothetical protein n=1 Tax=Salmonella enterica TaxID=28901 RepID=UPI003CF5D5C4
CLFSWLNHPAASHPATPATEDFRGPTKLSADCPDLPARPTYPAKKILIVSSALTAIRRLVWQSSVSS